MKVGDLVRLRPKPDEQCIQIVGIVTKITKFSVYVNWSPQSGTTSYNKNSVDNLLEVIDA